MDPLPIRQLPSDKSHQILATSSLIPKSSISYVRMSCQKLTRTISHQVLPIYQAIVNGNAHLLLNRDPKCPALADLGACANYFSNLAECACQTLNRRISPICRKIYEDTVIEKAVLKIQSQGPRFDLNMGLFATGRLFGEFVLMVRLIDRLRTLRLHNGVIRLNFIDQAYQGNITSFDLESRRYTTICRERDSLSREAQKLESIIQQNPFPNPVHIPVLKRMVRDLTHVKSNLTARIRDIRAFSFESFFVSNKTSYEDVIHGKAMAEFVELLTACLPVGIKLEMRFFATSEDYLKFSAANPHLGNHLFVGADVENTLPVIDQLAQKTLRNDGERVILYKSDDKALLQTGR